MYACVVECRLTCSLIYYALALNTGALHGDIYINAFVSGALEIPAYVVCVLMMNSKLLGRRWTGCLGLVGSGISCFLCIPMIIYGQHFWSLGTGIGEWVWLKIQRSGVALTQLRSCCFFVGCARTDHNSYHCISFLHINAVYCVRVNTVCYWCILLIMCPRLCALCLQCFDAVGWLAGRASSL